MSVTPPVIHVIDDDASIRTALSRLLTAAGYRVSPHASAGEFLLRPKESGPGCLILDVRMPGPSGLELQQALAREDVSLPVIFLTGHGDIPMSVRAIKSGAVDFLAKPVRKEALLAAVREALERDRASRESEGDLAPLKSRFASLTAREREVLGEVVRGALNKQIADRLGLAERTVKFHRAHVMEKMGAGSLADLVHIAERLGLPAGEARRTNDK